MKWGFWKNPFRLTFNEVAYSMLRLMPVEDQRRVFSKFVYESGRAAYEIGYWFLDRKRASEVDESKVDCPILIIAGIHDKATPASVVRQVADKYKAVVTYKEYDNHSHWVIGEPGWQEIAEYTLDWLSCNSYTLGSECNTNYANQTLLSNTKASFRNNFQMTTFEPVLHKFI